MGFTEMVYPGATNTRFHHALGALYLMKRAIRNLRSKGVEISTEEEIGVSIAILLHDIGHGPYSHALEEMIIPVHHERISLEIMQLLNEEFNGKLDLAISIFTNQYSKKYLHQLVSSQLDMDRMDYLIRDSYYTGVAEGVIGYDRLIKMLYVEDDELVIEEKGIYSVEKFLIARQMMYAQVYLHKTSLSAERMLKAIFDRVLVLLSEGHQVEMSKPLRTLIEKRLAEGKYNISSADLRVFSLLDDADILYLIKANHNSKDYILSYICRSLLDRKLFRVFVGEKEFPKNMIEEQTKRVSNHLGIGTETAKDLIFQSALKNTTYDAHNDEIKVIRKDGSKSTLSDISQMNFSYGDINRFYLYVPRL